MELFRKLGIIAAIGGALTAFAGILIHFMKNSIIISSGIKTFKMLSTSMASLSTILIVIMFWCGFKILLTKQRLQKEQAVDQLKQKQDPLYDEPILIQKLHEIESNSQNHLDIKQAVKMIQQINAAQNLQDDFAKIIDNNNQPVIQNIGQQLVEIRIHMLQDAKSVYRRLIAENDNDTIQTKLDKNDQLLNDADKLIIEAINYIDLKSESTELDLSNLTNSLKDLMKLI